MNTRYIPAIVMLLAGTVVSIISLILKFEPLYSLEILLAVLVVFYIIGNISRKIIEKAFTKTPLKKKNEDINIESKEEDGSKDMNEDIENE